ncbi:MAG: NAD(P)H-hydrate epimerase, partial [Oscillospiraceae bacterium]|nr:NAD(P)H-hydrate epimerase [Oscillospiraceae bacterium]
MLLLDNAGTKLVEELHVAEGNPHIKMMEAAGGSVARFIGEKMKTDGKSAAVVCGRGNNGGDGFACAKKLAEAGAAVRIILADGQPSTDDAIDLLGRCDRAELKILSYGDESQRAECEWCIEKADLIIDAIFGAGFHGEPNELTAALIEKINLSDADVVAVDIPSGVFADSGQTAPVCVRAGDTVTFTSMKPGHVIYPGAAFCGQVTVEPIDIDEKLLAAAESKMETIDYHAVKLCFRQRPGDASKKDFGTLAVVCGSVGMSGAAVFAGKAAVGAGAGLVRMALPGPIYPIVASALPDPVYIPLGDSDTFCEAHADRILAGLAKATACLIGCGMGDNQDTAALLTAIINKIDVPTVLDADALNIISKNREILRKAKSPLILTPHPGEMARLAGCTAKEVQARRLEIARGFAEDFGVYVILKGAN